MQTFIKVIETGSFSAAARQLRVGQPAVSKTVAQLEERLGLSLLLRSSRSFSATEAGQIFYEHAKLAIAQVDEAELAARGAGAGLTGRLRVSAGVTFARLEIVPKLGAFLTQHPKLEIELILDDRNVDLVGEGIDVALRMGALADSTLSARKIAATRRRVVGTPAYFARAGLPHAPADLADHEAVIWGIRPKCRSKEASSPTAPAHGAAAQLSAQHAVARDGSASAKARAFASFVERQLASEADL